MPRLFIGIKIDSIDKILAISNDLQKILSTSNINWVKPKNFHVTLKFLGDVENCLINSLKELLTHISDRHFQFTLKYKSIGYYGSLSRPRVIWFGFEQNSILTSLIKDIEWSLKELGFNPERNKFSPHLTLGRVKHLKEKDVFMQVMKEKEELEDSLDVMKFQLIESVLDSQGSKYNIIQSFALKNTLS
jgi:2'-5' RNA ligase